MERDTRSNKRNNFNQLIYQKSGTKRNSALEKEMEEEPRLPEWIKVLEQLKAKTLR